MSEEVLSHSSLQPQELEAVYAISKAVAEAEDIDIALDEIIKLARPVFIFDNMVMYLKGEGDFLEPAYARVVGRGRSAEAELAWGGNIANDVYKSDDKKVMMEKLEDWESNRLNDRLLLGLPLNSENGKIGALVFGRFGGPIYSPDQLNLAEFIAAHIAQLLIRQRLVERVANLEAERRLQQLQDSFIANISHELCTPLGFIKGYATTLLREDAKWDDESRREFLTIIDEESDRLRELIDNILDSSRLQVGTLRMSMQQVHLHELVNEAVLRAASRYPGLTINLEPCEKLTARVDPLRLTQVFDNLIGNAVKYAPGSPVQVSLTVNDQKCHIQVIDSGPGISPEHQQHLFERFYRVPDSNNEIHGTGLGLYICREIILAHGGKIEVESELGKGTKFHILFPLNNIES
jgi:signal transduction histidine kinase